MSQAWHVFYCIGHIERAWKNRWIVHVSTKYSKMETIHLYIMDISLLGSISGVDRYIEKLLEGLKRYPSVRVHWIQLLHDENLILYQEEQTEYYTKLTFPLPLNYTEIITKKIWREKYNAHIFHIIRKIFSQKENNILRLQTLNLIDLYTQTDHIICVTRCGVDFLTNFIGIPQSTKGSRKNRKKLPHE